MVERVADALYRHAVSEVRAKVGSVPIPLDNMASTFNAALLENDRSAAILIFAMVEDLLQDAIERQLNPGIKGGFKSLLSGNGMLATAHSRITIAAALYWIEKSTYQSLHLLREIRNRFAHHVSCHSFEDQRVAGWITSMHEIEKGPLQAVGVQVPSPTLRDTYFMRAVLNVGYLVMESATLPVARQAHVSPGEVLSGWEELPENLRELRRLCARFLLHIGLKGSRSQVAVPATVLETSESREGHGSETAKS